MDSMIFKSAEAIPEGSNPYSIKFIASTGVKDRYGDVLAQDWLLEEYRANPVVLWQHDSKSPHVGHAPDIQVKDNRLIAQIELAAEDTSPLVNNLRRLAEQKLLRAVSVGFTPGKSELMRDDKGNPLGFRFSKNTLLEISLVTVPANPEALALARSLSLPPEFADRYFSGSDPVPFLSRKRAILEHARKRVR